MTLSREAVRRSIQPVTAKKAPKPGALHSEFVTITTMTEPAAIESLDYSLHTTPVGLLLVASTLAGLCHLAFVEDAASAEADLKRVFPEAELNITADSRHIRAASIVSEGWDGQETIKLHVPGTEFQLSVWNALLKIPAGTLCTYAHIADAIGKPSAARAVGTAIGANRAAYLIPCHRVVRGNGDIGGFMWGPERKEALIAQETQGNAA